MYPLPWRSAAIIRRHAAERVELYRKTIPANYHYKDHYHYASFYWHLLSLYGVITFFNELPFFSVTTLYKYSPGKTIYTWKDWKIGWLLSDRVTLKCSCGVVRIPLTVPCKWRPTLSLLYNISRKLALDPLGRFPYLISFGWAQQVKTIQNILERSWEHPSLL